MHFTIITIFISFYYLTWFLPNHLMNVSMFSTSTIINFNILILYQANTISVEPQIWRKTLSAQEFCLVCFLHRLLTPKRSVIPIRSNLSFLSYLLWNTNWLNTARLLFLFRLLGHLADKCNSTNCFKIILSELFLPIDLASKSKATEEFKHNIMKI